ncbi:PefC/AfrB family outer membrane usher protein [Citrobacter rodentium]|uniref:Fimbrial usher protein n=2 Tax=Citrobacter rodentium TaxID=67825 RepID=D2TIR6_CITRI|nr:PefC/AfrB family outer membrane usher protein [Citrobacter rodentium]KIQ50963.1 fimbrial protein [Citrobacter rodentium]QBY30423.1 outer membrane usher protein PefC [Citrobacter rodentium]UHO32207.1 PefC/AfrB family outer membrane usher protein [Citrobacter rodentium NBRC 105723 = DSM 16636]CBG90826.1 putative fimbrial usher protein [Citrobacter rodentium ICC168]HAT8012617.1 outer membrane usher protein PefC [Citrobacter rodentium NBRC 105723 = DSM 16636]
MKKSLALCIIIFPLGCKNVLADGFNYSFIRGGSKEIPQILTNKKKNVPGKYFADIIFNGSKIASTIELDINENEAEKLCISADWLLKIGINLNKDFYSSEFDSTRQCFVIENEKNSQISFNPSLQELTIELPQAGFIDSKKEGGTWDYGSAGFKLAYDVNTSKSSDQDRTTYGNIEGQVNIGEWVLLGRGYAYQGEKFESNNLLLTHAIKSIKSDILIGKTQSYNTLNDGFTFYGAQLKSNQDMYPWDLQSYAPIINGIARTHARVTVEQGGYTLKSFVVPPGPFVINDLTGVYSGDIILKIYEEDGSVKEQRFPVAVLPNLLKPGNYNYNIAVGSKVDQYSDKRDDNSLFAQMTYDYGFEPFTLNTSALVDKNYNNFGLGLIRSFGWFGAVAMSGNLSQTKYHNGKSMNGFSASVKYARVLGEHANLQLISYRFNSENYIDYADFNYRYNNLLNIRPKQRYESIITYQLPKMNMFFNMSAWKEDYWDSSSEVGANVNLNKSFNNISVSLNTGYSRLQGMESDYNAGVSLSVPFSVFDKSHYSFSAINYDRRNGTNFNTGVAGSVNSRLSYNASISQSRNTTGSAISASYLFDEVQTSASYSQMGSTSSSSLQVGGSIIGLPDAGILFTPVKNDEIAIVQMEDVPGVRFNGSMPGDKKGRAVIPLTAYNNNTITVNADNLPQSVELTENAINVTPTENAIIYKKVKYRKINTYIVKVISSNGFVIPMGSIAKNAENHEIGYVNNGGILLMNLEDKDEGIISVGNCKFDSRSLQKDTGKVQEIKCG